MLTQHYHCITYYLATLQDSKLCKALNSISRTKTTLNDSRSSTVMTIVNLSLDYSPFLPSVSSLLTFCHFNFSNFEHRDSTWASAFYLRLLNAAWTSIQHSKQKLQFRTSIQQSKQKLQFSTPLNKLFEVTIYVLLTVTWLDISICQLLGVTRSDLLTIPCLNISTWHKLLSHKTYNKHPI